MNQILTKSRDDLKKVSFWTECICEFLATTILMTLVILVMVSCNEELYKINTTHLGVFVLGFVFMVLEAYGPISSLLNPMGALCMFLAQKISLARAILYIIIEIMGATAGTWLGYGLTPSTAKSFMAFRPADGLTPIQSIAIEAIFSFNLIFVSLSVSGKELTRPLVGLPNLAVACALAVGLWAGGTHTGGFMNPIISFGPAQLAGDFRHQWIYWTGPFIGGPLGVAVFKLFTWGANYERNHSIIEDAILPK